MAVKSVIDIEVNSQAFAQFNNVFNGYKKALEKTPKQWQQATKELKEQKDIVYVVNQNFVKTANTQSKINANASRFNRELEHSKRASASVASNMSNVAKSVAGTTFNFLKWGALGAFALGTGALFGIGSLTSNASRERNTGLSLGVSPSRARGLRDALGRYDINSDSLLSGILDAQIDHSKRVGFGSVNYMNLRPDQVLPDLLTQYRDLYKTDRHMALQQGANVGLDRSTLETLSNLTDAEFKAMLENIKKIASERYIEDKDLKVAQDLNEAFKRLTKHIEDNFLILLLKFEPLFKQWTLDLTKWIDDVFKSGKVEKFLNDLSKEVKELYDNLKTLNLQYKKLAENTDKLWGYFTGRETLKEFLADPEKPKHPFIVPKNKDEYWNDVRNSFDAWMKNWMQKKSNENAPPLNNQSSKSNQSSSTNNNSSPIFSNVLQTNNTYENFVKTYGDLNPNNVKTVVSHHTGGTLRSAMNTAKYDAKGYGAHFYIDKDGTIYQGADLSKQTAHILDSSTIKGLTNANSIGVEIVGKNNNDINETQQKAFVRLAEYLAKSFPNLSNVVPHGYANLNHKQRDEGMSPIEYMKKNQIVITNASGTNLTIITGGVQ